MIELNVDFDLETLLEKYRRIGGSMPFLVLQYNNRMAFNTRSISKSNLRAGLTVRPSFRFLTSGRALSVRQARFSRTVERIESKVGGKIISKARDPMFMARLEHGGNVPTDRFGRTNLPTVKGARSGSVNKLVAKSLSAPRIAALAVSNRSGAGSPKQKRAVAMATAIRERKRFVRMRDRQGRDSLYRVKGKGRGRNRTISEVTKLWTLSPRRHNTSGIHWLERARERALTDRVKTFKRAAEKHIAKRALKKR